MLNTFASRRPYSLTRTLWHILAGLVLVLVASIIPALVAGIGVVAYLATIAGGQ